MENRKQERMKELTGLLKEAARAYYAEDREIMSNLEYDRLYDELEALEAETGIVLSDSPTVNKNTRAPCSPWAKPRAGKNCRSGCRGKRPF